MAKEGFTVEDAEAEVRVLMADKHSSEARSGMVAFDSSTLYTRDPVIHDFERPVMQAVLQKLACCAEYHARLGNLHELQTLTKLNVSCEMVGFSTDGRVYLVQRPSVEEKPDEPYPLKWHALGSGVEPYEHWEDVFVRVAKKLGKHVVFEHTKYVPPIGYPLIAHDPPRGPYLLCIFTTHLYGDPTNPRGRFLSRDEVSKLDLVESHRNIILPTAFRWYDEIWGGAGSV